MALSDCINCWDTPCTCGWSYLVWDNERIQRLIETLGLVLAYKNSNILPPNLRNCSHEERANIMKNLIGG